jgi:hypothetical protein
VASFLAFPFLECELLLAASERMPFNLGGLMKWKPMSAVELVAKLRASLVILEKTSEKTADKAGCCPFSYRMGDEASCGVYFKQLEQAVSCRKETTELISMLKISLQGDDQPAQPPSEQEVQAYIRALLATDVLYHMISCLSKLHFETRKDVQSVFAFVCKYRPASVDGSGANSTNGVATQGMPRRGSARSASMADLNQDMYLGSGTPGLEHIKSHPALLEKLCACVPLRLVATDVPPAFPVHAQYLLFFISRQYNLSF